MAYRGRTQHDLYNSRESGGHGVSISARSSASSSDHEIWKGLVSGLIAGVAASWVMTQYQVNMNKLIQKTESQGEAQQAESQPQQSQSGENPTVSVAHKISQTVRGRNVSDQHKELAGNLVHYGFGALNGGLFGVLSEVVHLPAPVHGLLFGTGLWAAADEFVLPLTGMAKWWPEYPTKVHLNALGAHLVYGATTDLTHKGLRRLLGRAKDSAYSAAGAFEHASTEFHAPRVHPRAGGTGYSVSRFSRFEVGQEQPKAQRIELTGEQETRRSRREERRQAKRERAA